MRLLTLTLATAICAVHVTSCNPFRSLLVGTGWGFINYTGSLVTHYAAQKYNWNTPLYEDNNTTIKPATAAYGTTSGLINAAISPKKISSALPFFAGQTAAIYAAHALFNEKSTQLQQSKKAQSWIAQTPGINASPRDIKNDITTLKNNDSNNIFGAALSGLSGIFPTFLKR